MNDELRNINWAEADFKKMYSLPKPIEPAIDEVVSQVVGMKIYQQDPRLLKLIVKWKRGKPINSMEPDNFLEDPRKIAELREVLSKNL